MKRHYCPVPTCDGVYHYSAAYDPDTGRWYPVDSLCPEALK